MQSLKILFDWLHLNNEIMLGCYRSNPEFVNQKIMKLINVLNIDIFTRKIFFDRSMLKYKNVRENLRHLFDIRHQIATSEDVIFKKFPLFEELQQPIDWNLNYKLQLTPEEDIVLRNFKIVDFGFHLCKVKKFNYSFCARSRIFIERKRRSRRGERNRKYRDDRKERRGRRRRNRNRGDRRKNNSECERLSIKTHSQNSNSQDVEEFPSLERSHQINRKGYLRNKVAELNAEQEAKKSEQDKAEMMGKLGKLWLKNEVKTLESRSKPVNTNLTPYLMLDTKSLSEYLYVVKNLVKTKKFVVLIPKAGKLLLIY
jgi:protein SMG5